ncbi:hypothetical protein VTL71DRAFT_5533 [Oculimacula yallundae]|uniref:Uncharacterized protein n=1 Tax=Oculimacula yallundae TaxID=86028 RepID=A0ABR4C3V5_9HELO
MKFLVSTLLVAALAVQNVEAATWYFLRWYTPNASAQLQKFSMTMTVPPIRKAGTYYLWPGLQDTSGSGVFQQVLDGRKGAWWIGSGWCCSNPSLPWGSGFSAAPGNKVTISNTRDANGVNWSATMNMGTSSAKDSFPLGYKNFNQALLAIELTGVTWDFGPLTWNNVVMVMNTTQTGWCTKAPENYGSATKYTMTTPRAVTVGGTTTCTIDQVVMQGPA